MVRHSGSLAALWKRSAVGGLMLLVASVPTTAATEPTSAATVAGITYVTKNFTLNRGAWATFRAPCPSGTHVLGGGHYNTGSFSDLIAAHSYPYDSGDSDTKPDDGWAADVGVFNHSSLPVTIHAMCAKISPVYAKGSAVIPGRYNFLMDVVCPATHPNVFSGGSRGPRTLQEFTTWARGGGDGWAVGADNLDNEPRRLTVIAVCSTLDPSHVLSASKTVLAGTQTVQTAQCPSGAPYVAGGGVVLPSAPYASRTIAALRPVNATDWEAWVDNFDITDHGFQAGVVCIHGLT